LEEEFADIDRIDVPIGATGRAAAVAKQQRDCPPEAPQQQQQNQVLPPPPLPLDEGPVVREYDLQVLDAHLVKGRKNKHKGADADAQQDVRAGDGETAAAEPDKQRRKRRDVSPDADRSPDRPEQQQQHQEQQHVQDRQQLRRQQEQRLSPEDDGLDIAPGRGLARRDSPERSGSEEGEDQGGVSRQQWLFVITCWSWVQLVWVQQMGAGQGRPVLHALSCKSGCAVTSYALLAQSASQQC
jgi:hypothetical protein